MYVIYEYHCDIIPTDEKSQHLLVVVHMNTIYKHEKNQLEKNAKKTTPITEKTQHCGGGVSLFRLGGIKMTFLEEG